MNNTRRLCFSAIMLAVGILLPMAFHTIPNGGNIFSPMHLPVFITGFLCGPTYGALVGLVCPLTACLFTGMPNVAYLPNMMAELLVYGAASGLFFRIIKTGKIVPDALISLVLSMLLGRIVGGCVAYLLFLGGTRSSYSWTIFFTGYFVTCWPAIVIQILVVPTVVTLAKKYRFIRESDRYLDPSHHGKNIAKQKNYFNGLAESWRKDCGIENETLEKIFGRVPLPPEGRVLDAGCGTGVIDGYLLTRCRTVDAVDISEKMIEKARLNNPEVNYFVADFYGYTCEDLYDCIIVFDAYPHFIDKEAFAAKANSLLKEGGTLWIAFDESREKINGYHTGLAGISVPLQTAEKEGARLKEFFEIISKTDDNERYLLGLKKKN